MLILPVDAKNIRDAALVHSLSWQESHRAFCSAEFILKHTPARQEAYLLGKMEAGSDVFLLTDPDPKGIVSVNGSLIEDLYVHPLFQRRGYGSALLHFAVGRCAGTPTLWILENNARAKALYLKRGFRETGNRKSIKNGLDEIELALSEAGEIH